MGGLQAGIEAVQRDQRTASAVTEMNGVKQNQINNSEGLRLSCPRVFLQAKRQRKRSSMER